MHFFSRISCYSLITPSAPTNDAFEALPEGLLDTLLLPENIGELTNILLYHVVPNEVLSSGDLVNGDVLTMANGDTVDVSVTDTVRSFFCFSYTHHMHQMNMLLTHLDDIFFVKGLYQH